MVILALLHWYAAFYEPGAARSLAGSTKELIGTPGRFGAGLPAEDVLSDLLRTIRLTGAVQFCFMPMGDWETDAAPSLAKMAEGPSSTIPFHIVVEGTCWMKMEGVETVLEQGDIVAFPFGTGHQLGAGTGGRLVTPVKDLPAKPWRDLPVLRYGDRGPQVRLLCGFLQCDAMNFQPLREALPRLLHVKTHASADAGWLRATIAQIIAEADSPRTGSLSMLERLTEITFIELLRQEIATARSGASGWLAALADPAVGRCLSVIHENPKRAWTLERLTKASALSRTALGERFEAVLGTSPMRYVRDWRLYLASSELSSTAKSVAAIGYDAGYGTEAAFSRAFSRAYGMPPARWRKTTKRAA
jgi:AraC-like DNA-binding protein